MDGEEFIARYLHILGLLDQGKLVTVIPTLGTLDWQEYELDLSSVEALFSWPDGKRAKMYCELLVRRGAQIEAETEG